MKIPFFFKDYRVIIFLVSTAILLILVPIGSYSHPVKFFVSFWVYLLLTIYIINKHTENNIYSACLFIALPILIIYTPIYLFFVKSITSLPSSFSQLGGILFGVIIKKANKLFGFLSSLVLLFTTLWIVNIGYGLWNHRISYGTFTGNIKETAPNFSFVDVDGNAVNLETFEGKTVIFDFWTTNCGACFTKFPLLDSYFSKFRNNENIRIYSVNIPIKRDTSGAAEKIIRKLGYKFPVLYAQNNSIFSEFKINGVPTVVVIDSKKNVVYRGQLKGVDKLVL